MDDKFWKQVRAAEEVFWENSHMEPYKICRDNLCVNGAMIKDASERLDRFAPLIQKLFPETKESGGIIESPLIEIENTRAELENCGELPSGRLFLKCDSHLAIAGSVKARGGIYEVLKHTEELAFQNGLLKEEEDYGKLAENRKFFSRYKMQVGSTGNLGMSIGIMSAALGYQAIVHMSADAKQWKKELLRSKGVIVKEYEEEYSRAVCEGRKLSEQDPDSYFVDDEHSKDLFLGYAVAGERLKHQLMEQGIEVSRENPLYVYIPCGVGGAPGGITYGLKEIWGDNVHCFFVEPVQSPCMLVGMASGKGNGVSVQDYGLTGKTDADGLAVQRASGFVAQVMEHMLEGIFTVRDERLYQYMAILYRNDGIVIEPSACAAFAGYADYCRTHDRRPMKGTHIIWATGGSLMPEETVKAFLKKGGAEQE